MENEDDTKIILDKERVTILDNKKLSSMGPDTIIIIPRKLIKYNIINPDKRYNIYLEEITD